MKETHDGGDATRALDVSAPTRWARQAWAPGGCATLLGACVLHSAFYLSVCAQPYEIDWHTIDGGGGTSAGGVYAISGTIGQPDSGPTMTNGQYAVTGGFWALPQAIQTPGAPLLSISAAGPGFAEISWAPDTPGIVLQETMDLSATNWMNSPSGETNPVVVPAVPTPRFYRLSKP